MRNCSSWSSSRGRTHAVEIDEGAPPDRLERLEAAFGEHGRLVGLHDRVEEAGELLAALAPLALEPMQPGLVRRAAARQQQLGACALELELRALIEVGEAMPDQVEVVRVELLLLHQHLLADADLAEVVQQAGVAQLAQLLAREGDVAIRPARQPIHRLRPASTVIVATRPEWPEVAGSRDSIAVTAAVTNPSNSRSMSSYRRPFSIATAACDASAVGDLDAARVERHDLAFHGVGVVSTASGSRLRLISCSTPMISSRCVFIGSTSIDFVR